MGNGADFGGGPTVYIAVGEVALIIPDLEYYTEE